MKQLNGQLEQARIAAGLIRLAGTGIVLQLEDSRRRFPPDGSAADYLVGARDIRTVVEELWLSGAEAIAVNGERITPTTAIIDVGASLLVNSAYLAPPYQVTALGPDRPVRPSERRAGVRRLRRDSASSRMGSACRSPNRTRSTCLRSSGRSRCATRARWPRLRPVPAHLRAAEPERLTMHRLRSQLSVAAVALVLGLLVVVQLRTQAATPGSRSSRRRT